MATHGTIGAFESNKETWVSYAEWIEQYFITNDVDDPDKKESHSSQHLWCQHLPTDPQLGSTRQANQQIL